MPEHTHHHHINAPVPLRLDPAPQHGGDSLAEAADMRAAERGAGLDGRLQVPVARDDDDRVVLVEQQGRGGPGLRHGEGQRDVDALLDPDGDAVGRCLSVWM